MLEVSKINDLKIFGSFVISLNHSLFFRVNAPLVIAGLELATIYTVHGETRTRNYIQYTVGLESATRMQKQMQKQNGLEPATIYTVHGETQTRNYIQYTAKLEPATIYTIQPELEPVTIYIVHGGTRTYNYIYSTRRNWNQRLYIQYTLGLEPATIFIIQSGTRNAKSNAKTNANTS